MTDTSVNAGITHRLYTEGDPIADTKAPAGPIDERWTTRKFEARAGQPRQPPQARRHHRRHRAGGRRRRRDPRRGRLQRQVVLLPGHPRGGRTRSPPRAASTPRRTTRRTATPSYRLFYDTVKGGDYRSRESNVYRLAEVSANIIDQCVAQGVPFAREYGGLLDNRSFGGVQVSRTFYARGQTGQQLLIGAYQALERQVAAGTVEQFTRHEMLELVVVDGQARGIIARDLVTGEIETHLADAVVLASRRLRQRLLPVHQRDGLQRHGHLARTPQGRLHGQPLLHADPPDLHPGVRRPPVASSP